MDQYEMENEIAKLRAENERLTGIAKKQAQARLALKVSDKGGLSIYGLGRFPVTLYASQWARLLGAAEIIQTFLTDHAGELSEKS